MSCSIPIRRTISFHLTLSSYFPCISFLNHFIDRSLLLSRNAIFFVDSIFIRKKEGKKAETFIVLHFSARSFIYNQRCRRVSSRTVRKIKSLLTDWHVSMWVLVCYFFRLHSSRKNQKGNDAKRKKSEKKMCLRAAEQQIIFMHLPLFDFAMVRSKTSKISSSVYYFSYIRLNQMKKKIVLNMCVCAWRRWFVHRLHLHINEKKINEMNTKKKTRKRNTHEIFFYFPYC